MKRNKTVLVAAGMFVTIGDSTGTAALVSSTALATTGNSELFIRSATQLIPKAETVSLPHFK